MTQNRLLTAKMPQPGEFCKRTGYYVMVYSYYPGGIRTLDKYKKWCTKGFRFPPYSKFVVSPNKALFPTSKLRNKGYLRSSL